MKQREKCSGRGCESPQVHHKYFGLGHARDNAKRLLAVKVPIYVQLKYF